MDYVGHVGISIGVYIAVLRGFYTGHKWAYIQTIYEFLYRVYRISTSCFIFMRPLDHGSGRIRSHRLVIDGRGQTTKIVVLNTTLILNPRCAVRLDSPAGEVLRHIPPDQRHEATARSLWTGESSYCRGLNNYQYYGPIFPI